MSNNLPGTGNNNLLRLDDDSHLCQDNSQLLHKTLGNGLSNYKAKSISFTTHGLYLENALDNRCNSIEGKDKGNKIRLVLNSETSKELERAFPEVLNQMLKRNEEVRDRKLDNFLVFIQVWAFQGKGDQTRVKELYIKPYVEEIPDEYGIYNDYLKCESQGITYCAIEAIGITIACVQGIKFLINSKLLFKSNFQTLNNNHDHYNFPKGDLEYFVSQHSKLHPEKYPEGDIKVSIDDLEQVDLTLIEKDESIESPNPITVYGACITNNKLNTEHCYVINPDIIERHFQDQEFTFGNHLPMDKWNNGSKGTLRRADMVLASDEIAEDQVKFMKLIRELDSLITFSNSVNLFPKS